MSANMAQARCISNTAPPLVRESHPREQLVASLTKIVQQCKPHKPWNDDKFKNKPVGLWTGPTAIAYLFLWLSETHPDLEVEGVLPREWCLRYMKCGSDVINGADDLNGWGVKNEYLAFNAVKAAVTQDPVYVAKVADCILFAYNCPAVDNEHLAGRAGALSLLRIIQRWCPSAKDQVEACTESLIEQIMNQVPWRFHGHNYIGAAHGVIGILTQIILSDHSMAKDKIVESLVTEQLDLQDKDGHWFITDDPMLGEPDLVHYCHGSPGFVISLLAMKPYLKDELQERIDLAVQLGRQEVWQKGLLTKEPNLCHGIVGNMLALDEWHEREHFMAHATAAYIKQGIESGTFVVGDDPFGLFWGEAGRAWGWMMIDSRKDLGYPSYTDI